MAQGGGAAGQGTVFRLDKATGSSAVLHSFQGGNDGGNPVGGLLKGTDGALYGATSWGGGGVIFRLNQDGTAYAVLYVFGTDPDDGPDFPGFFPLGSLTEGRDGFLYGATEMGGVYMQGTLFRILKDGSGYRVVHTFTGAPSDGGGPASPLIQGNDDRFYGVTHNAVFGTAPEGGQHEVLHTFAGDGSEGRFPNALFQASDGVLYGTTTWDATSERGTIFKLNPDGTGFTVLRVLSSADGIVPTGGLVEDPSGYLRGMVRSGGPAGGGNLFRITKDGSYYSPDLVFGSYFSDLGYAPVGCLLEGSDGYFYGTTSRGGARGQGTVFSTRPAGLFHTVLWHFERTDLNGRQPLAPLMQASDGRLYGTTDQGGTDHLGTLFSLNPDGSDFRVLRHTTTSTTNGRHPEAALIEGTDGRLYGTTAGIPPYGGRYFGGTVFRINKDGSEYQRLWPFAGAPTDGELPDSALVQCEDGRLYGTTRTGGTYTNGTIFRLNSDGSAYVQPLIFTGTNGAGPNGLTKGSDGLLYGTTRDGGAFGAGTVFKIRTDGSGHTLLKHFPAGPEDIQHPGAPLLEGTDGVLYGTCEPCSASSGGAIFCLQKDGSGYTVLRRLGNSPDDGYGPAGALVEGGDGVLYGATTEGGCYGGGVIFRLHKDGSGYRELSSLPGSSWPLGAHGLIEGADGALYGITYEQGDFGYGTIYRAQTPTVLFGATHEAGRYSFGFNARADRVYAPQYKNALSDAEWLSLPSILNTRGLVTVTDTNLNSHARFYRVISH